MVFFTCSVEGCEARSERLVRAQQQHPDGYMWFDQHELPEGWGSARLASIPWSRVSDVHATYCPEHAVPDKPR